MGERDPLDERRPTTAGAVIVGHLRAFFDWVSEGTTDREDVLEEIDAAIESWRDLADQEIADGDAYQACGDVLRFYEAARVMVSGMIADDRSLADSPLDPPSGAPPEVPLDVPQTRAIGSDLGS